MTMAVAAGGSAGGSPPAPAVQFGSNDNSALVFQGTGTTPGTGTLATVAFGGNYSNPIDSTVVPKVSVRGLNAATNALGLGVTAVTTLGCSITNSVAPSGGLLSNGTGLVYIIEMGY